MPILILIEVFYFLKQQNYDLVSSGEWVYWIMKKTVSQKTFFLILAVTFTFILVGCFSNDDTNISHLTKARDAISNQDYNLAKRYAESVVKKESNNNEAQIMLEYLKYKDNILLATFWENDPEAMRYIAPIVHDINRKDPRYEAPVLVLAAAWGQTDMVKILLEERADPNYGSDKDGLTALMWACKNFEEQLEMVKALLEAGADIHAKSIYNETPLSIAEEYMNPHIVLLINEYSETLKEKEAE